MNAIDVEPAAPSSRVGRDRRRRGRNRRALGVVAFLALLLIVPALVVGGWFWLQLHPTGGYGDAVAITVQPGWGNSQIADALEQDGVIGSSLVFRMWERDAKFRAGTYALRRNMGVTDAAAAMGAGEVPIPQVGVLPGLRLDEIAPRIATIKRFSADRFLTAATDGRIRSRYEPAGTSTLEGLLAPDSYPVTPTTTEAGLTQTMVRAFDDQAATAGLDAAAAQLGRTPYAVITVASLVQREAKLEEDRPLIAAVIYNRLRAGMPLQIDATRQYAQATGRPEYDTYRIPALPPTPISTVSKESLSAAMHPAAVSYRYYVLADASGKHAFADTYEQHLQNVAAARRKGLLG
jgi:UPF0755 protein